MRISDWISDVCSSDLHRRRFGHDRRDRCRYRHRQRLLVLHRGGRPQPGGARRRLHDDDAGLRPRRSHRALRAGHRASDPVRLTDGDRAGRRRMPQFDPSTYPTQPFWLLLTFVPLYLVVWRVALPRLTDVRQSRQGKIEVGLEKAQALKEEAEMVLAAYEKALADAQSTAEAAHREAAAAVARDRETRERESTRRNSSRSSAPRMPASA